MDQFVATSLSPEPTAATLVTLVSGGIDLSTLQRRHHKRTAIDALPICLMGHSVLRQRSAVVEAVTDETRAFVDQMFTTMHAFEGVGLAANQVGVAKRIAVVDVGEGADPMVLINPRIIDESEETVTEEEGCLSIPDIFGNVERSVSVLVDALDYNGQRYRKRVWDYEARAVQHEIDHLDGILFLDRLGNMRRNLLLSKWKKLRKGEVDLFREPPQEDPPVPL